jgi:hypothetical protein
MWGRMSAAKPPRAAPGLAVRGGTAVAPCHKGTLCPRTSVRSRHAPLSERVPAQRCCPRRRTRTSTSSVPPHHQPPSTVVRYRGHRYATIFSEQRLVSADERRPASQAASTLELHLHRAVAANPSW